MVDLRPDLSMYNKGGVGSMSLGDLVGVATKARQYRSDQAVSESLRGAYNKDTKTIDYPVALNKLVGSGELIDPETMLSMTHASQAQSENQQWQFRQAGAAVTSLLTKRDRDGNLTATPDDFNPMVPTLRKWGVDGETLNRIATDVGPNGTLNEQHLTNMLNWLTNNSGFKDSTVKIPKAGGGFDEIPYGEWQQRQIAARRPVPPPIPGDTTSPEGRKLLTDGLQRPQQQQTTGGSQPGQQPQPGVQPTAPPDAIGAAAVGYRPPMLQQPGGTGYPSEISIGDALRNKQGAEMYAQHQALMSNYEQTMQPLRQAIINLKDLKNSDVGVGSRTFQNIQSFIMTLGSDRINKIAGVDANKIKTWDQADKYLQAWAGTVSGGGTDARLMNAYSSNPGMERQREANLHIAQLAEAAFKAQRAQFIAFHRTRDPNPGFYGDFSAQWNPQQDISAYGIRSMSPEEQEKTLSGIKGRQARLQFERSLAISDQLDQGR